MVYNRVVKKTVKKLLPARYNPFHWRKAAYRDAHGLRNRAWLFDTAERLYVQKKSHWDFLLLYIDLRGFREINNQFSHTAGNEVLKKFYELLEKKFRTNLPAASFKIQRNVPEKDIVVVREGGDEFIVFLPLGICDEVGRKIAIYAVNKRLEDLHISYKGVEVTARIAMVVSTSDKPFDSFLDFFIKADKKLTQLHKSEK
jgi:GGDEF domain-containing protein